MKQRIFILGAGRFGTHLATRLSEFGCEVVLADRNPRRVKDLAEDGFQAMELDADDETALKVAGVQDADVVVVAIGENMQASIMSTMLLKELNVKKLVARAVDSKHGKLLERLGADLVILPTRDMAYQLAERLRSSLLTERLPLSSEYQIARVRLGHALHGRTLAQAQLPRAYQVIVVLVTRQVSEEASQDLEPTADFTLKTGDILVVVGKRENIDQFEQSCCQ